MIIWHSPAAACCCHGFRRRWSGFYSSTFESHSNLLLLFYVSASACNMETSLVLCIYIHSSVFTQEQAVFHCWKSSKRVTTAAIQLRSQRRWERNESSSKNKCSGVGWQDPFCLSLPAQGPLHWLQMLHPIRITASLCGTKWHTEALLAAFLGWKEAQYCPCVFFCSMSERWGVLKWWHKTGSCSQGPRTPVWAVCAARGFSFQFSCNYLLWSINYTVFI